MGCTVRVYEVILHCQKKPMEVCPTLRDTPAKVLDNATYIYLNFGYEGGALL